MLNIQFFRVTETVWCIRRPSFLACSYLIETKKGPVLMDVGMNSDGRDIRYAFEKIDKPISSLRGMMLSHWHNDHVAGASIMHEESGAPVYYHEGDEPYLTRKKARLGIRGFISDLIPEWSFLVLFKGFLGEATPNPVVAEKFVKDGDVLFDDFVVVGTPGHTTGHLSYYYKPEKVLFSGDALAVVNKEIRFLARPVNDDIKTARKSMIKLMDMDIDVICPGHRIPLTKNVKEECQRMKKYLEEGKPWPLLG